MKRNHLTYFWWVVLLASFPTGCASPAGAPASGNLPGLLSADAPGEVRLRPAWTGSAHDTLATGSFLSIPEEPKQRRLRQRLRFNRFQHLDEPWPVPVGPRILGRSVGSALGETHTYREELPRDAELEAAQTLPELGRLLGPSHHPTDGWGTESVMHSSAGWAFFALRDEHTLETLSVACQLAHRRGDGVPRVEGLRVTRGIARPDDR